MSFPTYVHNGRRYRVLARFDGAERAAEANDYIDHHTHVAVLCDTGEFVIVASDRDFGEPEEVQDSGFGTQGWKSLLSSHPKARR